MARLASGRNIVGIVSSTGYCSTRPPQFSCIKTGGATPMDQFRARPIPDLGVILGDGVELPADKPGQCEAGHETLCVNPDQWCMRVDAEQLDHRPAQRDSGVPVLGSEKRQCELEQAPAVVARCRRQSGEFCEDVLAVRVGKG